MGTMGSPSSPTVRNGPAPITAGQLLLLDPLCYVNLLELFPPDGAKSIDEIQALSLDPQQHQLLLLPDNTVVLLQKRPPSILLFERKTCKWVPVRDYK